MQFSEQPTTAPAKLALSVSEAVAMTGLGRTTLYDLMEIGRLPFVKLGTRRLLMTDDLRALLMAHRQDGRAAA